MGRVNNRCCPATSWIISVALLVLWKSSPPYSRFACWRNGSRRRRSCSGCSVHEIAGTPQRSSLSLLKSRRHKFLEAGIVPQWVPFPAKLQIVHGHAVIHTVDRAGRAKQSLDQWDGKIVFAEARIDERQITIHDRAVVGVFRFGLQLHRPPALANGIFFSTHEGITQSKVCMPLSAICSFHHRALKGLASSLETFASEHQVATRGACQARQKTFRSRATVK